MTTVAVREEGREGEEVGAMTKTPHAVAEGKRAAEALDSIVDDIEFTCEAIREVASWADDMEGWSAHEQASGALTVAEVRMIRDALWRLEGKPPSKPKKPTPARARRRGR